MKYRCRCSRESCRKRYTFDVHPHSMGFDKKCGSCGGTQFRVDVYRQRVGSKENRTCSCDGVHTKQGRPIKPHRWGCEGCIHREDAVIDAALRGKKTTSDESWLTNPPSGTEDL